MSPLKHLAVLPISNGVGEPAEFDDPDWPRYVRTTDIAGPRSLRPDTFRSLPPDIARRATLQTGDLVMTAAGGVGKSMLYVESEPACYAGYLVRFRPKPNVDGRFVGYWAESQHFWDQVEVGKVVSTIDNFSAGKYQSLSCPAPDFAVQKAIADYLDAETARIDALIAKKQRMIELVFEWRRSAIEEALGGGRSAVDYLSGANSATRRSVPLKRLLRGTIAGGTPDSSDERLWASDGQGVAWLSIGDMVDSGITISSVRCLTPEGLHASRLTIAPPNTLLFAMYASLGKLTTTGLPAVWNQAILGLVPNLELVDVRFLALWLEVLREHLSFLARSSTQENLNAEQVRELPVPAWSHQEQSTLVAQLESRLEHLSTMKEAILRQIDLLGEHRQALITAAVTGELEIPGVAA
jgi:type I restriction enzyme S subunit